MQWTEFTRQLLRHAEHCVAKGKNRPIEPLSHPWDLEDPILVKGKAQMKIQIAVIEDLKERIVALKKNQGKSSNQRPYTGKDVKIIAP